MIETEVCAILAANPTVTAIVGDLIMDQDYRASQWENAINYLGAPITILDQFAFMKDCIVVDAGQISRSPNLRGAGRYSEMVHVWIFTQRGPQGKEDMNTIRNIVYRLHETTVPSRAMLLVDSAVSMDDGKNMFTRITLRSTFIPQEAGEMPPTP